MPACFIGVEFATQSVAFFWPATAVAVSVAVVNIIWCQG